MMFEDVSSSNGAMEPVTRSTLPMDFGYWESLQVGGWDSGKAELVSLSVQWDDCIQDPCSVGDLSFS